MKICSKEKCTACYACLNVCPINCISMQMDSIGVLYPKVDEERCVNCNLNSVFTTDYYSIFYR